MVTGDFNAETTRGATPSLAGPDAAARRPPTRYAFPTTSRLSGHLSLITKDKLKFLESCANAGPFVRLRVYHVPVYVVSDPQLIGQTLVEKRESFVKTLGLRTMAKRLFGQGLLTSEGELWERQQRIIRPHFLPRAVQAYMPSIVECVEELVSSWNAGSPRDVHADMARVTLKIACRNLFGEDAWMACDAILRVTVAAQDFYRLWERLYLPFAEFLPVREAFEYRSAIRRFDAIVHALIARRKASPDASSDLLSVLVRHRDGLGNPLPDALIRDEIITMFLASYETTAAAAAWTIYLVSTHRDVLRKVREEIERCTSALDMCHRLRELRYLHDAVREALRLYPSVPVIGREAREDVVLGGHPIRRGGQVLMSPWAMQRSPRYWKNAGRFIPERWAAETDRDAHSARYVYFPFGGGPRICTGQNLAVQEVMLITATVVRHATLRYADPAPPEVDPQITMVPRAGTMRMMVESLSRP
jgi:cytochrome P450